MALWKASVLVGGACSISYLINKWKYGQKKYYYTLKLLPLVPAWFALLMKLKPGRFIDRSFVAIGHCLYHAVIASLFCKWIPLEYGVLIVYLPLPLVFQRSSFGLKDIASHNDIFYKYYIQLFWSLPIISSMKLLSNIYKRAPMDIYLNHGIQSPSISIINDDICLGRIPLNCRDVEIMTNDPFNIGAVINMCIESNGPLNEYNKYDIKFLNLPCVDTLPPKLSQIEKAMEFIQQFVLDKDNEISESEMVNNKRILIHCRGGRSRSATIALCWILTDSNMTIPEAMKLLCSKRKAVHPKIEYYDVVYQYAQKLSGDLSRSQPVKHKRLLSFHLMD